MDYERIGDYAKELVRDSVLWIEGQRSLPVKEAREEFNNDPEAVRAFLGALQQAVAAGELEGIDPDQSVAKRLRREAPLFAKRVKQATCRRFVELVRLLSNGTSYQMDLIEGANQVWKATLGDATIETTLQNLLPADVALLARNRMSIATEPMRYRSVFESVQWFADGQVQSYRQEGDNVDGWFWDLEPAELLDRCEAEAALAAESLEPCTAIDFVDQRIDYELAWMRHIHGVGPAPADAGITEDRWLTAAPVVVEWSTVRSPSVWRALLGVDGQEMSKSNWKLTKSNNPDSFASVSTQKVQMTRAFAESRGLSLPEFAD